jgi:hypothetical protein
MSLLIVHKRRQRSLLLVFDRPELDTTHMSYYTTEAVFCSSRTFQTTSKNVCAVSQLCHLTTCSWPPLTSHCVDVGSTAALSCYQFQRLPYNYEFRDYVNIFVLKCRLRLTFQLLSNFGPCIKLSTSTEKCSYSRVINWIKSKLIKVSYVKRRRRAVRSPMVHILQNRLTDCFFTPAAEPQWKCISYIRIKLYVLHGVNEERNILHTIKWRKANWICHILCRNCLLEHVNEGKIEETSRRGIRRKQLMNDLTEKRRHWNLTQEALGRTR